MRLVVDASAWIDLLCGGEHHAALLAVGLPGADAHVPALCDIEVVAALRKLVRVGEIDASRAELALDDYLGAPMRRYRHEIWLRDIFALRDNFTAYDAAYVSLAAALDATLVTLDRPLARAARRELGIATAP